ncbi:MAG: TonB-dependent receptor [Acidobacteria bacterium]|nr:TonB-dependent receptor [Acidobacteriota bacterium]
MKRSTLQTLLGVAVMAFFVVTDSPSLTAQTVTGTILGTVRDSTGALIPGVEISVKNVETGAVRSAITDDVGTYHIPSVPAGPYEVTASIPGFRTGVRSGITVTVGASVTVNFDLAVGELAERVEVSGEAPLVDTTTSTMMGLVDDVAIRELPLNGRDWVQLTTLQAGAVFAANQTQSDGSRTQRGSGMYISISGGRWTENAYRIDGLVVNDYANAGPGSAMRVNLGVDAVREFSVLTNMYSAASGRSSGGVINAITKSGTNEIHGTAFYFHRNSAMDARNFFDKAIPPFRRHQFGASVGGPVRKDKTFFFANYEGLREFLSLSSVNNTLSPNARNGILTTGTVTIDSRVKPYLDLYPLPNGQITGNTGQFIFGTGRKGGEDFVMGKMDHSFSERTSLNGSYSYDNASVETPTSFNRKVTGSVSRRQNVVLSLQHAFNPTVISTTRTGFTRTHAANEFDLRTTLPALADPSLGFLPGLPMGSINPGGGLTGLSGLGSSDSNVFGYTAPQLSEDLSWVRGRHILGLGFSVERILSNVDARQGPQGNWFGSIEDFLTLKPQRFATLFPGTNGNRGMRMTVVGAYLQDDLRLRRSLTVNIGVRYEMATVVKEVNGKLANLRNLADKDHALGDPYYRNPTLRNFAPRLGFAWDPLGDGKTSVRAGFGFFDLVPLPYLFTNRVPRAAPFFEEGFITPPPADSFPNKVLPLLGLTSLRGGHIEFEPHRTYKMQWNLNIERQLLANLALKLGYVGATGVHLPGSTEDIDQVPATLVTKTADGHYLFPTTGTIQRINLNYGRIAATLFRYHSSYHALQATLTKRFSGGFFAQGSYTWSKSMDNGSNTFSDSDGGSAGIPWPFDPNLNRGVSDFNVPHNLAVNFRWDVPSPASLTALPRFLLAGWELGGIFQANSGVPFTVKQNVDRARTGNSVAGGGTGAPRPHYNPAPGCTPNAINPGNPDQYVKLECFSFPALGVLGNLGRHTLRGPGLVNFDLSLFKNKLVGEKLRVQFRAEAFNVFNRANFSKGLTAVFDSQGRVIPTATRLSATKTTSRQIQFGMKFVW